MMDWDDLRYIVAVHDAGSALAAAQRLGVNPSTVQRHTHRFEKQNGVRLDPPDFGLPTFVRVLTYPEICNAVRIRAFMDYISRAMRAIRPRLEGTTSTGRQGFAGSNNH